MSLDLGTSYLQVAHQLSAYIDVGVESRALVTEVVPDSPAQRAGIREGDIISVWPETDRQPENSYAVISVL